MRAKGLLRNYPTVVPVSRLFTNRHDLSLFLFGLRGDRKMRSRALRFLTLAGAFELFFLADRWENATIDRIGFKLTDRCTEALKALAWRVASTATAKVNAKTVPDFIKNGIHTRPRGRPAGPS
jgi:hypothetical protein